MPVLAKFLIAAVGPVDFVDTFTSDDLVSSSVASLLLKKKEKTK